MTRLEEQIMTEQVRLEELKEKRIELSHHVALMRPDSLDLDMLDQRAREVLNYTHPDDIIYYD